MFSFLKNLSVNLFLLCLCYLCVPRVLRPNCDQNLSVGIVSQWSKRGHREYRNGVKIGILILTILLVVTGCSQKGSSLECDLLLNTFEEAKANLKLYAEQHPELIGEDQVALNPYTDVYIEARFTLEKRGCEVPNW